MFVFPLNRPAFDSYRDEWKLSEHATLAIQFKDEPIIVTAMRGRNGARGPLLVPTWRTSCRIIVRDRSVDGKPEDRFHWTGETVCSQTDRPNLWKGLETAYERAVQAMVSRDHLDARKDMHDLWEALVVNSQSTLVDDDTLTGLSLDSLLTDGLDECGCGTDAAKECANCRRPITSARDTIPGRV